MQLVTTVAAVLLAAVFAVSVAGKVRSRSAFAAFVRSVPGFGVPARLAGAVAVAVTVTEAGVVALLAWSLLAGGRGIGLWAAAGLMAVLTVGVLRAVLRGEGARCRCFGQQDSPLSWVHVGRNAGLLLVAGGSAVAETAAAEPHTLAVAVPLAGLLALVVVRLEDLAVLFRSSSPTR
ncbi:hypothetical protein Kfla_5981 [Kribbella flavida DSM 17836]|uniref:Methylamine utilisation protein MauE domain-containing protein n=1 Tax=Kribbella flavida (strain DSM 17836 / JCM 10339 / NBRC 14399) TaxID=479435 RepID=D2PST2_KRIFD|nr:MauE/DoxX family redox-associated membrane protein [Kribbella flavida]ADB34984.1 hypothetical protein Kfla_5981 [Kribbella flavida DSM 17836]